MNAVIIKCRGCREDYIVLPIANRNYFCPYCRDFGGTMVAEIPTGKYTIMHKMKVKKKSISFFHRLSI